MNLIEVRQLATLSPSRDKLFLLLQRKFWDASCQGFIVIKAANGSWGQQMVPGVSEWWLYVL